MWFIVKKMEWILSRKNHSIAVNRKVFAGLQNILQIQSSLRDGRCDFNHFVCCEISHQAQWADDPPAWTIQRTSAGWQTIFNPVFFSFHLLTVASLTDFGFFCLILLHLYFWSSELPSHLSLDSAWGQTGSSGSDRLIIWSHQKQHGFTSEELCSHTFEPGARLPVVWLPEAPAAAGGGEGPLDEVAESGGFSFISLWAISENIAQCELKRDPTDMLTQMLWLPRWLIGG